MSFIGGNATEPIRTRQILQKLSKSFGAKSKPTFGGLEATDQQIVSTLPDGGISPLAVTSKVLCENLNAEYLGGHRATEFVRKDSVSSNQRVDSILIGNWRIIVSGGNLIFQYSADGGVTWTKKGGFTV